MEPHVQVSITSMIENVYRFKIAVNAVLGMMTVSIYVTILLAVITVHVGQDIVSYQQMQVHVKVLFTVMTIDCIYIHNCRY